MQVTSQAGLRQAQELSLNSMLWEWAAVYVRVDLKMPYFNQTPKDRAEKLKQIVDATNRLLTLLKPLDYVEGQDLEVTPFDLPLVQAISSELITKLIYSAATDANGISQSQLDEINKNTHLYPTRLIDELKAFRDAAVSAATSVKPGRGNSTDRTANTNVIHLIAKNFTWQYFQMF